jgi:uncharacterized protein (TIGR01777 family)
LNPAFVASAKSNCIVIKLSFQSPFDSPNPNAKRKQYRQSVINKQVLVTGASGLIGTALVRNWMREPIHLVRLVRSPSGERSKGDQPGSVKSVVWNPLAADPVADLSALIGVEAAVHLSGANVVGRRWSTAYKQQIVSSRVQSTRALVSLLKKLNPPPRVLVCASAIGIYGDRGNELLTEWSTRGTGFLAETCEAWEDAAKSAEEAGIRVVHTRFGVVLSPEGGALAKMLPFFRLGLGGTLGDGQMWMPWVSLGDAVAIIGYCLENEGVWGPVNVVSPNPVTNAEFTKALAVAVHRPAILPAPAFALRLAFGEMANEALLASARVMPTKLTESGYRFVDPVIGPALNRLLSA